MPFFRRRPSGPPASATEGSDVAAATAVADGAPAETPATAAEALWDEQAPDRPSGPWDVADAPDDDVERVDLGSMRVPIVAGLDLRVEGDQSGVVVAVSWAEGQSMLQVQPFAAPRTLGIWEQVRTEIREQLTASGGQAEETDGPYGPELRAVIPVQTPEGTTLQPARFVGVDGPRWFLRGLFLGRAGLDPVASSALDEAFREVVVARGPEPLAPKTLLPLVLSPESVARAQAQAAAAEDPPAGSRTERRDDSIDPFERGPEITEIR